MVQLADQKIFTFCRWAAKQSCPVVVLNMAMDSFLGLFLFCFHMSCVPFYYFSFVNCWVSSKIASGLVFLYLLQVQCLIVIFHRQYQFLSQLMHQPSHFPLNPTCEFSTGSESVYLNCLGVVLVFLFLLLFLNWDGYFLLQLVLRVLSLLIVELY